MLLQSAVVIGFYWDPLELAWSRPGLPLLSNLSGPFQHFRAALLSAWRDKVSADLCPGKGFRGGPLLDVNGTLQLLNSDHVRERDEALSEVSMLAVSGMVFCFRGFRDSVCLVGSVVLLMMMVIFFGIALFLLSLRFVKILSFMISLRWISRFGLGVCFGMVGCLCFRGSMEDPRGLRALEKALVIFWSGRWVLFCYAYGMATSGWV